MASSNVDVLIVGAGPVGLFLANECARRGIAYRIIKDDGTQSTHSKALAIYPRTLEVFDMAGIAEPFLQAANRVTKVSVRSHERELGHVEFQPAGTPYQFIAMIPQDVTEKLLLEQLRGKGGDVEYETKFLSLSQTDSGVEAVVERAGTQTTIAAKYLAGCDGAHSAVRQALGLAFEGAEYKETYILADAITNDVLPVDEMHLCPSQLGPLAIFPMSATRRRIIAIAESAEGDAPSLELINDILTKRAPNGLRAESLVWAAYFRIHHRCVAQMGAGRAFVSGDAAHIHSPYGGQGMNTGLQDAWNLAWKLDLAVRGLATDGLLPSYTQERHPIVLGVIEITNFLTNALGPRHPVGAEVRDVAISVVTHIPKFKEVFTERMSGLGNAYKGSPIVEGGGKRYFDASLGGGKGIASRFILMVPSVDDATTAGIRTLESQFSSVLEVRSSPDSELRLLRPDGYVAYEGVASVSAVAHVEEVLRRQVRV
jgi:2-polyprenyl-6-methoxyphenol hydroxylase-like FAD-dependent oxidoreductase